MKPYEAHAAAVGRGNHDLFGEKANLSARTSQRYGNDPQLYDFQDEPAGRPNPLYALIEYLDAINYARIEAIREGRKTPGDGVRVIVEFLRNYAAAHYDMGQPAMSQEEAYAQLDQARAAISTILNTRKES
ncbi:MAG: hypothetical protein U0Y68_08175 [Blastocatellia bacterium]